MCEGNIKYGWDNQESLSNGKCSYTNMILNHENNLHNVTIVHDDGKLLGAHEYILFFNNYTIVISVIDYSLSDRSNF